jgi:hypothetical protein
MRSNDEIKWWLNDDSDGDDDGDDGNDGNDGNDDVTMFDM